MANNMKNPDDIEARLAQMQINTRLTALQTALEIMKTPGYTGVPGQSKDTGEPVWVYHPGRVDGITLLAMASDIENYIIGSLEDDAKKAIEKARNPHPVIVRP